MITSSERRNITYHSTFEFFTKLEHISALSSLMQHDSVADRVRQVGNVHIGKSSWAHAFALTIALILHSAGERQQAW